MASIPRQDLPDDFAAGRPCSICGAPALRVAHLKSFPDYVVCSNCRASFVAEAEGDRVLYGNIPESFPAARAAALRKWMTLAEVEAVASGERPVSAAPRPSAVPVPPEPEVDHEASLRAMAAAAVPIPTQPEIAQPPLHGVLLQPEDEVQASEEIAPEPEVDRLKPTPAEAPLGRLSRLMAGGREAEPVSDWAPSLFPDRPAVETPPPAPPAQASPTAVPVAAVGGIARPAAGPAEAAKAPAPAKPAALPAADPPPGQRYRVALNTDQATFPTRTCAHCMRSPSSKRLTILGSVPLGAAVGQRKMLRFTLPLCRPCYRRATARTPEEKNARLNAYLISALVALALLVVALAAGVIDPAKSFPLAVMLMLVLLVIGYAVPAAILLRRAGRFPPPEDARYVRTTLLIPEASQGLEIAFEWRNQRYAEEFYQANRQHALAGVVGVKDRATTV
jgi:hypothetical protein